MSNSSVAVGCPVPFIDPSQFHDGQGCECRFLFIVVVKNSRFAIPHHRFTALTASSPSISLPQRTITTP